MVQQESLPKIKLIFIVVWLFLFIVFSFSLCCFAEATKIPGSQRRNSQISTSMMDKGDGSEKNQSPDHKSPGKDDVDDGGGEGDSGPGKCGKQDANTVSGSKTRNQQEVGLSRFMGLSSS